MLKIIEYYQGLQQRFWFGYICRLMDHAFYMHRCLELARLGAGFTAPNPMVGAVLVYEDRILGEGYHALYGQAHAEVNALENVSAQDRKLIPQSTLYVSLEPCAHYGKTPPCASRIVAEKIPRVVIACRDPFEAVNGKGIEILTQAGIEVITGVLEKEARELNARFFTFHFCQRPYVILKWAQSADGLMAAAGPERTLISNAYTQRLVHQWRGEEASILVGYRTALLDDPALTQRFGSGRDPIRLVWDPKAALPMELKLFDQSHETWILNTVRKEAQKDREYVQIGMDMNPISGILTALTNRKIISVLVEGGSTLLRQFLQAGIWDEARIIINNQLFLGEGLAAPVLPPAEKVNEVEIQGDTIHFFKNKPCFS